MNADLRDRAQLLDLLVERSYAERDVVLASGQRSNFFVDAKQTILTAVGHALAGKLMLAEVRRLDDGQVVGVAGVELGGCPLASAVSTLSATTNQPLDALYVRKAAKNHGSQRLIEGSISSRQHTLGSPPAIAILEDVITTGGSTLACVEKLRAEGYKVAGVVVLVDRQEGGRQHLEAAGLPVRVIFERSEFPGMTTTKISTQGS